MTPDELAIYGDPPPFDWHGPPGSPSLFESNNPKCACCGGRFIALADNFRNLCTSCSFTVSPLAPRVCPECSRPAWYSNRGGCCSAACETSHVRRIEALVAEHDAEMRAEAEAVEAVALVAENVLLAIAE